MSSTGTGWIYMPCKGCGEQRRLADTTGLARNLGISRALVHRYARRVSFPRPVGVLAGAFIWDLDEVLAWRAEHIRPWRGARK